MDKAHQESLVIKFDVDLDPKTNVEYRKGTKKSFYLEIQELKDDYEGSQEECTSLKADIDKLRTYNDNQMNQLDSLKGTHASDLRDLEEVKKGLMHTNKDLEEELAQVRSKVDKLTKQHAEDQNVIALADEEILGMKEVAAEWEHKAKSVRKIPLLGCETLSYQSDILLRWQDHMEHWNELVSDFQDKYCPALSALTKTVLEFIDSFVRRVKNVEIS